MVNEIFELITKRTDYIAFLLYMRDYETVDESNIKDLTEIVNNEFSTIVMNLLIVDLIGLSITENKFRLYLTQRGKVYVDRLKYICEK